MTSPPTRWPVRPLTDDDWDEFVALDSNAFGMSMDSELLELEHALHRTARDIGAHDGSTLIGIAAAYAFELSVPGGSLPAAGISWVGVLPTHRRRGVLRSLMEYQLRSVQEEGTEPVALLWASEPQIYGRFGYGLASRGISLTVPRSPTTLHPDIPADPTVRLRLVDAGDWKLTAPVYFTVRQRRPGMPGRDEQWWQRAVRDVPSLREGGSELRCVIAEDDEGVRGYARYSTKQSWGDGFGSGAVSVRDVMAMDPPALAALYGYLFDLDLMGSTNLGHRPPDDPVLHWLQNPRTARPVISDALYVRMVDVRRALASRSYAAAIDVVVEVRDDLLPANSGRWRLAADLSGATCDPTQDAPDLAVAVADLGAVYLGGTTLSELAEAGRVAELRAGSLAAASAAFVHSPAPWCPFVF